MIDWKSAAKTFRRQLRSELQGSKHLHDLLLEETIKRIDSESCEMESLAKIQDLEWLISNYEMMLGGKLKWKDHGEQ